MNHQNKKPTFLNEHILLVGIRSINERKDIVTLKLFNIIKGDLQCNV